MERLCPQAPASAVNLNEWFPLPQRSPRASLSSAFGVNMRRILTTVITMYWMASFAVLAMVCTLEPDHGMIEAFRLLGLTHIPSAAAEAGGVWLTGTFGIAFGLVSLVFLWALVAN